MKKLLFISFVLLTISFQAQINLTNGLVAYFPLDGDVNDYSPLQINGINYNATPAQSGNRNYYAFNGYNAYIYAGYDDRNITNKITVSAWINTTSNSLQWIVGHYDHNVDRGFQVLMDNGHVQLRGRDSSNTFYILSDPDITSDGDWHHIVGLFDNNRWTLIVDCQIKNYLTTTSLYPSYYVNSQPFSISKYPELNNGTDPLHFNGGIDEVRVYNRILSLCEICRLHGKAEGGASISNRTFSKNMNVYPNPTRNQVIITYEADYPVVLQIYDTNGKFLLTRVFTNSIKINTSRFAKGTYLVVIKDKDNNISKKLIIGD